MLRATAFAGGTVLDWGCGPGDLYFHLTKLDLPFTYVGTDIDPRMVELAASRGVPDVRLVDLDFRPERTYDYVFASGIFQFQDPDDPLYFLPILEAMYDNSARAAAATFLSAYRPEAEKAPDELYVDGATIARIAAAITDRWVVDHSYHPAAGDLTVGLLASRGTAAAVKASGNDPSPPRP
ncbi:class I SAM-dependent methyltransferase [Dactylosporangium sp. NPDC005572]|uniref:class I SAM-dependent methyltransferase n=1 Tax=Dactylosporangium sp. NPDC005572 TaxID=3156889 RepID=UPI0033AB91DD